MFGIGTIAGIVTVYATHPLDTSDKITDAFLIVLRESGFGGF
jgi:hypothetical protein